MSPTAKCVDPSLTDVTPPTPPPPPPSGSTPQPILPSSSATGPNNHQMVSPEINFTLPFPGTRALVDRESSPPRQLSVDVWGSTLPPSSQNEMSVKNSSGRDPRIVAPPSRLSLAVTERHDPLSKTDWTPPCNMWYSVGYCRRQDCNYSHDEAARGKARQQHKGQKSSKICRKFASGKCNASKCSFAHVLEGPCPWGYSCRMKLRCRFEHPPAPPVCESFRSVGYCKTNGCPFTHSHDPSPPPALSSSSCSSSSSSSSSPSSSAATSSSTSSSLTVSSVSASSSTRTRRIPRKKKSVIRRKEREIKEKPNELIQVEVDALPVQQENTPQSTPSLPVADIVFDGPDPLLDEESVAPNGFNNNLPDDSEAEGDIDERRKYRRKS